MITEQTVVDVSHMSSYPSIRAEDQALINVIRRQAKRPPSYHIMEHNCIKWSFSIFFVGKGE